MEKEMTASEKPLVSFVVFAYNQEAFVRQAVEAALAQTYLPLEIILSDDASQDATATIIRELAEKYRGPHKVIVNINEKNLGIGGHVTKTVALAQGEFLVFAAGDDISKPERTTMLVDAWLHAGRCAGAFHSGYDDMSENGEMLGTVSRDPNRPVLPQMCIEHNIVVGATEAWSRSIFDTFGPLHPSVIHEDRIAALRAALLDGLHYVDYPLVAYRRGGISMSPQFSRLRARRDNSHRYAVDTAHMICDIELARRKSLLTDDEADSLLSIAGNRLLREALLIRTKSLIWIPIEVVRETFLALKRTAFVAYKLFSL